MSEYVFEKPYEFEGKTYEKIEFDLEGLKGSDISDVKRRFSSLGVYAPIPVIDSEFCALVLAHLVKQPIEFFSAMPARDYVKLTQQVSNFLSA